MISSMPLLLLALTSTLAAPAALYDDYVESVPQKRPALVLDRLLFALRRALADGNPQYRRRDRSATLQIPEQQSSPERRGDSARTPTRGRVLRCYFNAITCF